MKKKFVIGGAVLLVIVLLISVNIIKAIKAGTFGSGNAIQVKTAKVEKKNIKAIVPVSGVVEEVEKEEIYFDSPVKITNVYVKDNDYVKKGQKLVELDLDDMNNQLNEANINLNIQQITLSKIQDSFKLQNTSQLQSVLNQAKYQLDQAQKNYERTQKLFSTGAVSQVELDNAKMQLDTATTQYNAAQSNLDDLIDNNSDLQSNNSKDIKSQMEQIRLTQLRINDLRNKINKLLAESVSPIDGYVSNITVQKGGFASSAMMAMRIINPDALQISLEIKEVDALKVKEGQEVEITGDAFADRTLKGFVKSVGAEAVKKQTVSSSDEAYIYVKVTVDNTEKLLRPGLSVNADIITTVKNNAVTIPFDGFVEDKDGNKVVYVINNNIAKEVKIKVGISSNLDIEVISGLKGNETIVKEPPSRLKDGSKIIVNNTVEE